MSEQYFRLIAQNVNTKQTWLSPLVYPEQIARKKVRSLTRYDGLLFDPKKHKCTLFPVQFAPKICIWDEDFEKQIDPGLTERIKRCEKAWEKIGGANANIPC